MEKILIALTDTTVNYKGMRVNLLGIPVFKNYSKNSVKSTTYRLIKRGLIEKKSNEWQITHLGKKYLKRNMPKNLIVMFDIPETQKAEREWFRWHLKKFNYKMIQKSVWVGPSPLPKEFMEYIEKIKLKDKVKTFRLAKGYKI